MHVYVYVLCVYMLNWNNRISKYNSLYLVLLCPPMTTTFCCAHVVKFHLVLEGTELVDCIGCWQLYLWPLQQKQETGRMAFTTVYHLACSKKIHYTGSLESSGMQLSARKCCLGPIEPISWVNKFSIICMVPYLCFP